MIEKVTLQSFDGSAFRPAGDIPCEDLNPKALLLYAAAKCAGLTLQHILEKQRIRPRSVEIGIAGDLTTDTVQSESMFRSFHVLYDVACGDRKEQVRVGEAIRLTHEKHCSMMQMLRRIAPVSHEIAIVVTEPAMR